MTFIKEWEEQLHSAFVRMAEQLAQAIAERQGGGEVFNIAGQINAALVNIDGTTTIQSLKLNISPRVEISAPPQSLRPSDAGEFIGRTTELNYYLEKLHSTHLALLIGMAGVGKTALAGVLARKYAKHDKIFRHSFHARDGERPAFAFGHQRVSTCIAHQAFV